MMGEGGAEERKGTKNPFRHPTIEFREELSCKNTRKERHSLFRQTQLRPPVSGLGLTRDLRLRSVRVDGESETATIWPRKRATRKRTEGCGLAWGCPTQRRDTPQETTDCPIKAPLNFWGGAAFSCKGWGGSLGNGRHDPLERRGAESSQTVLQSPPSWDPQRLPFSSSYPTLLSS